MKFQNKMLNKAIYKKINKSEDLNDDDIKRIKDITLNTYSLSNEDIYINLKELKELKYLESCTLDEFIIDDEIINILNSLQMLKTLILNHCKFKTKTKLKSSLKLLIITYCEDVNLYIFENRNIETLYLIENGKIDIKEINYFKNIKSLSICNMRIINFEEILEFKNLNKLKLDGSHIDNIDILKSIDSKIDIEYKKIYNP